MSMWRTRTLTPEQKAQMAEEQEDQESFVMLDSSGPIQDLEDAKMSRVYSAELPFSVSDSAPSSHHLNYYISLSSTQLLFFYDYMSL